MKIEAEQEENVLLYLNYVIKYQGTKSSLKHLFGVYGWVI